MSPVNELPSKDVELVKDLLERSELATISFHEVSAKLFDGGAQSDPSPGAQVSLGLQHRSDPEGFGIRIVADIAVPNGEVRVTAAVDYKLLKGVLPVQRVLELFANEVAIMTLFPYLREGVADISSKVLGAPIMLPIAHRGQIGFDVAATRE